MRGERMLEVNGVELCAEGLGDPANPAILLIHGAAASMYAWEDEFCERLAARRFVVRYDHRDTGKSTSYPPGRPGYTLRDLTEDAVGLLGAYGLDRAHLVGRSMGGGIALGAALSHPARVASLTLVATSPGGPGLPPMSQAFLDFVREPPPDGSDRAAVIEHVVGMLRLFAGGSPFFDEAAIRAGVARELERTRNVASSQINHFAMETGPPPRARLGELRMPTLVIHGRDDPIFPLGHALAMQKEIAGAELLVLERTGHLLPRAVWDVVIPAIERHTAPC